MRVVNLLTFKGVFSRVRRGRGRRGDLLSRNNPKAEWQIVAVSHMLFLPQQVGRMRRELSVLPDSNETADLTAQSVR